MGEPFSLLRLDGATDIAVRSIGSDEFFPFLVLDDHPGNSAAFSFSEFGRHLFSLIHLFGVDFEIDEIFSENGSNLLLPEELLEFMVPTSPRGSEVNQYVFVFFAGAYQRLVEQLRGIGFLVSVFF